MTSRQNSTTFKQSGEVTLDGHHGGVEPLRPSSATADPRPETLLPCSRRHAGLTVWFTGLSSAGKSTICEVVRDKLVVRGHRVEWLDGDVVRQSLSKDLGFSKENRDENVRRIGFVANLLARNGIIVLVSAISPYAAVREEVRRNIGNFVEVFVHAPLNVCEQRDVKGIYRRVRSGEISHVTGVDDPYEAPMAPDVECRTDREHISESAEKVLRAVDCWLTLEV